MEYKYIPTNVTNHTHAAHTVMTTWILMLVHMEANHLPVYELYPNVVIVNLPMKSRQNRQYLTIHLYHHKITYQVSATMNLLLLGLIQMHSQNLINGK